MASRGSLFGYDVESEFPLVRLRHESGTRGALRILRAREPLLERQGELCGYLEMPGTAQSWVAVFRAGDDFILWCSATGAYLIRPQQGIVEADPMADEDWFEHRLVSAALPLLLAHRGDLVLHASAVVSEGEALLFCGSSGRGKSTLAFILAERGYPILTEDGIALESGPRGLRAMPGPLGVRVATSDSAGMKETVLLQAHRYAAEPATPKAIVVLRERRPGKLDLTRLERTAALPALMPHAVCPEPERLGDVFGLVAKLARRVPVFEAHLPDDLARSGEAAAELAERVTEEA